MAQVLRLLLAIIVMALHSGYHRSRKSVFTTIAQAGDSGPQASAELSPSTLDARTLLTNVGAAILAKLAKLSELGKPH